MNSIDVEVKLIDQEQYVVIQTIKVGFAALFDSKRLDKESCSN